jgi:hypothetical protein
MEMQKVRFEKTSKTSFVKSSMKQVMNSFGFEMQFSSSFLELHFILQEHSITKESWISQRTTTFL